MIELTDLKTSSHALSSSYLPDGAIRVAVFSSENAAFNGYGGAIVNITVDIPVTMPLGDYAVIMENIRMATTDEVEFVTPVATSTISVSWTRGDVNADGGITLSDIVSTISYILQRPTGKFNVAAADISRDGNISMVDVVGIVNLILNSTYTSDYGYNAKRGVVATNGDRLTMSDSHGEAGSATIPVALENATAYTAFQMDVELPDGATLASASLSSRAAASHSITWQSISANKVRVVAYSINNSNFVGNAGELVKLNVHAAEGLTGTVSVDNVRMATASGVETVISGCGSTIAINGTTGINDTEAGSLKVYAADGALVVESGMAINAAVYSVSGKLVKTIEVAEGKNVYEGIPAGTYVVAGVKVAIK
jgi:hypothetical protein